MTQALYSALYSGALLKPTVIFCIISMRKVLFLQNVPEAVDPEFLAETRTNYKEAIRLHDKYLNKYGPSSAKHHCFPLPMSKEMRKQKKYQKVKKKKTNFRQFQPLFDTGITNENFKDNNFFVCKEGEKWRTPAMEQKLKCYFLHQNVPYLKLGPLKVEEKSHKPLIVHFKQFLSVSECKHYKAVAMHNLKRSQFGGQEMHQTSTSIFRTSKQTWLQDLSFDLPKEFLQLNVPENIENPFQEGYLIANNLLTPPKVPTNYTAYLKVLDPIAFKITQRIEMATQMTLTRLYSSEPYQVANYGIGGQYGPHFDSKGYLNSNATTLPEEALYYSLVGDRFATFMAYLSDVQMGGMTSFPRLGLASKASLGDAIFWLNLESNGAIDRLTSHSGCPVIIGSKWITNKWILYHDQFQKYKCSLDNSTLSWSTFQKR